MCETEICLELLHYDNNLIGINTIINSLGSNKDIINTPHKPTKIISPWI